jgi:heme exporter protein A
MPAANYDFDELAVRDISHHFGRQRALMHVSLECGAGEIVGLLGPNGAGKSTLMALLSTLTTPSSGEILYGGRTAREAGPALRGRLGLLGHDVFLYPQLTARENLAFFAQLYDVPDVRGAVERALNQALLTNRADDAVSGFSRGMRQRLALERALIHGPRLLLLDEPFTGLDDASGMVLTDRLAQLKAAGHLVVMATHDLDLAEGLLDRVIVLRDGRIVSVQAGSSHLRERYREALAAERSQAGQGSAS